MVGRRRAGGQVEPLGEPEPPTESEEQRARLRTMVGEVAERSGLDRRTLSPADWLLSSTVAEAWSEFMTAREAAGLSPGTLRTYDLVRRQAIEAFGADTLVLQLTPRRVQDLQLSWRRRGLTDWTIAGRTVVLKSWLYWGVDEGRFRLQFDPSTIRAAKGKRKPRARSLDEVERLLTAWDPNTHDGFRNRVMTRLALDTGARAAEVTGMDVADVSADRRTIRVLGKGSRTRALQVSEPMAPLLDRWIRYRAAALAAEGTVDDGVLFPASRGRSRNPRGLKVGERRWSVLDRDSRMRPNVFTNLMREASRKVGIDPPILPHALRRTWATIMVRSGIVGISTIQQAGGWENLSTMSHYLAEAGEQELASITKASPSHQMAMEGTGGGERARRKGRPRKGR